MFWYVTPFRLSERNESPPGVYNEVRIDSVSSLGGVREERIPARGLQHEVPEVLIRLNTRVREERIPARGLQPSKSPHSSNRLERSERNESPPGVYNL